MGDRIPDGSSGGHGGILPVLINSHAHFDHEAFAIHLNVPDLYSVNRV
jgi:hypothetical protein